MQYERRGFSHKTGDPFNLRCCWEGDEELVLNESRLDEIDPRCPLEDDCSEGCDVLRGEDARRFHEYMNNPEHHETPESREITQDALRIAATLMQTDPKYRRGGA